MTESDEFLGATLRQAMTDTVDAVQPGPDGFALIQARIAGRPPRPPLAAALAYAAERVRYWTWRGHWTYSRRAPARRPAPHWGFTGQRLVAALGGVAVIVSVLLAVQPFRSALIQASSTMLNGGSNTPGQGAGTEGNGARAPGSGGQAPGGSPGGAQGRHASPGASGQPSPGAVNPDSAVSCAPAAGSTPAAAGSGTSGAAAVKPDAVNPDAVNPDTAVSCAPATAAPGSAAPSGAATSTGPAWSAAGGGWYYTEPAAGGDTSSATPTPSDSSPQRWLPTLPASSPAPSPTDSSTPIPTDSPSPTPTDSPAPTPTDSGGAGTGAPYPSSS